MSIRRLNYALFTTAILSASQAMAQTAVSDSIQNKSQQSETATLNAEQGARPREITLGFPYAVSTPIFEDGLPVSYYQFQLYPYKSWRAGVSAESTTLIDPSDFSLLYNDIKYVSASNSKYGAETFGGKVNYTLNQYGQHQLDMNVAGPIKNGWEYSLSTYQNWDPSSNHMTLNDLQVRSQFYKGGLQKRFANGRGLMGVLYQYTQFLNIIENFGPFIFVGDGSVKSYNGFNLGIDNFTPDTYQFDYMDMKTGQMRTQNYIDGNTDYIHMGTFKLDYNFLNNTKLEVRSRVKIAESNRSNRSVTGVTDVTENDGFTYINGKPYVGKVQNRYLCYFDAFERSWMTNAELTGRTADKKHSWLAGASYWYNRGGTVTSSLQNYHEVCVNPQSLALNGDLSVNYNAGGEYYDGFENRFALIAKDTWRPSNRFSVAAGVRAEFLNIGGDAAYNKGDDTSNTRRKNYSVDKVGKIVRFGENFFNYSAILDTKANLFGGVSALANFTHTLQHTNIFRYGGAYDPGRTPRHISLIRAGLSYRNDWMDITSQLVYACLTNEMARTNYVHVLQKDANGLQAGMTEGITHTNVYTVASTGWDTDMTIRPTRDFSLHTHVVFRSPVYKDFAFNPVFSDGVEEHYDFSRNTITNMSRFELEVEPTYKSGDWRVWLRVCYRGKRYINKTNSLFFNGRWETFGGVDYTLNKHVKFAVNLVNILNQKGANGTISAADLVTDGSAYHNYVMSGTFIRPFTMEFATNITF